MMKITGGKGSSGSDGSSEEILESNLLPKNDDDRKEGDEDDDTCGLQCFGKRLEFDFLEIFATPTVSLILICIVNTLQGFMVSGLFGATISTLEKRFDFWSTDTGLIASCYNVSSLIVVLGISYVGGKGHKPSWIAWGTIVMGISSVLYALPHFFAPEYSFDLTSDDTCNGLDRTEGKCTTTTSNLQSYKYFFIACWLLCGAGGTPLSSLAVPYLDENVKQNRSSLFTGVFYASEVVGPALGYFMGSHFLSQYTDVTKSVDMKSSDPQWIGNWWIGFLVGGILTVVTSIPILCLPKHLPNTRHIRLNRDLEVHGSKAKHDQDDTTSISKINNAFKEMLDVCRNPTYLLVTCAFAAEMALLSAFVVFGAKYFENVFGLSKESASIFFGSLTVVGGALGSFSGGVVVTKARMDVKGIFKFVICSSVCSLLAVSGFFLYCPDRGFAGATVGYNGTEKIGTDVNFFSSCNQHCGCSEEKFDPVCGSDNVTYFSHCFAGCTTESTDGESFSNCSCIPYPSIATTGVCATNEGCSKTRVFFFITCFIFTFCTFLMQSPALQAVLRVVPFSKRPLAVGIKFFIERIIGSIPGPIIAGAVLDQACTVWNVECGVTGSCNVYDNQKLSINIFYLNLVAKALALTFFVAAIYIYKPPSEVAADNISDNSSGNFDPTMDFEELPIITTNHTQEENGIIDQRV